MDSLWYNVDDPRSRRYGSYSPTYSSKNDLPIYESPHVIPLSPFHLEVYDHDYQSSTQLNDFWKQSNFGDNYGVAPTQAHEGDIPLSLRLSRQDDELMMLGGQYAEKSAGPSTLSGGASSSATLRGLPPLPVHLPGSTSGSEPLSSLHAIDIVEHGILNPSYLSDVSASSLSLQPVAEVLENSSVSQPRYTLPAQWFGSPPPQYQAMSEPGDPLEVKDGTINPSGHNVSHTRRGGVFNSKHRGRDQVVIQRRRKNPATAFCPECRADFTTKASRDRHVKSKHRNQIFRCDKCPKIYADYSSLGRHVRVKHVGAEGKA